MHLHNYISIASKLSSYFHLLTHKLYSCILSSSVLYTVRANYTNEFGTIHGFNLREKLIRELEENISRDFGFRGIYIDFERIFYVFYVF